MECNTSGLALIWLTQADGNNLTHSLRFFSGLSEAIAWSALVAILLKFYPNQDTIIAAYAELLFGLGYMMGEDFWFNFASNFKCF